MSMTQREHLRLAAAHSKVPWQKRFGLPERYAMATLAGEFHLEHGDPDAWDAITEWIANMDANVAQGEGLLLYGEPGRGKTHLVSGLLAEVANRKTYSAKFITAADVVDLLHRILDDGIEDDDEHDKAQRLYFNLTEGYDILVIDDVGNEYRVPGVAAYAKRKLEHILRTRGNNLLTTIITTNYERDALEEWYGSPFVSYLDEICEPIPVHGDDLRRNKRRAGW